MQWNEHHQIPDTNTREYKYLLPPQLPHTYTYLLMYTQLTTSEIITMYIPIWHAPAVLITYEEEREEKEERGTASGDCKWK